MKQLEELFVPYNLAVKLRELGFDEPCFGWIASDGYISVFIRTVKNSDCHGDNCAAPLYQQVVDWFREKHNIHISVSTMAFGYIGKLDNIPDPSTWSIDRRFDTDYFENYYKALTKAIEEALKLI